MEPFIFDTLGGPSESAVRLLKKIARDGPVSSARDHAQLVREELQAISVIIQKENMAIVLKSFEQARP